MSDLAMYESLASALLRRHGNSERELRRALADIDGQRLFATGDHRAGLNLIGERLLKRLHERWPAPPERYP